MCFFYTIVFPIYFKRFAKAINNFKKPPHLKMRRSPFLLIKPVLQLNQFFYYFIFSLPYLNKINPGIIPVAKVQCFIFWQF